MSLERQSREDCKRPHPMHRRAWLYLEGDNSNTPHTLFSAALFTTVSFKCTVEVLLCPLCGKTSHSASEGSIR